MEKKELLFADIKRSLNRLEGFIDDLLLNVQSFNDRDIEDVWTQLSYWVSEVHNNREGDDSINYIGINDCVDFILNCNSIGLAKMAFSIETKVKEIESIVLSYISYQITQKVASDFLWETGRILWQIGELYIEPFIHGECNSGDIYPTIPKEVRDLFPSKEQCESFVRMNYGKSHKVVANAYLEEKGVVQPESPKYVAVKTTLYNYFILPFKPKGGEDRNSIYCDPSTFYRHFKY